MPYKELLGSDEAFYSELLRQINPRLKDLSKKNSKKYSQYVKRTLNMKPEMDEDVANIASMLTKRAGVQLEIWKIDKSSERGLVPFKEPTDYGLLRDKVNMGLKILEREKQIQYGPGITKEMVILWLFFTCGKGGLRIYLSKDEFAKVLKIAKYLRRRRYNGKGTYITSDKYWNLVLDMDRWLQSFADNFYNISEGNDEDLKNKYVLLVRIINFAMDFKVEDIAEKVDESEKNIFGENWGIPCCHIYALKCTEKLLNVKMLKSDRELRKIWGISRTTFKRRMDELASIDGISN